MCVIVYKSSGAKLPEYSTLARAWRNNPDGAGYLVKRGERGGHLIGRKGFFSLDALLEDLAAALGIKTRRGYDAAALWTDEKCARAEIALHFRIGTSGGYSAEFCHPFNLSAVAAAVDAADEVDAAEALRACAFDNCVYDVLGGAAVMHNGVISGMGDRVDAMGETSDTMEFVRDVLSPVALIGAEALGRSARRLWTDERITRACRAVLGNDRFLIMAANMRGAELWGEWVEHNRGVFWSNKYSLPKVDEVDAADEVDAGAGVLAAALPWGACCYCAGNEECISGGAWCMSETAAQIEAFGEWGAEEF